MLKVDESCLGISSQEVRDQLLIEHFHVARTSGVNEVMKCTTFNMDKSALLTTFPNVFPVHLTDQNPKLILPAFIQF